MGMSTHICGIKPPDETWEKMKAIYDTCEAAGVEPPMEVLNFFDYDPPDAKGVIIEIQFNEYDADDPNNHPAVSAYSTDSASGYDIEISKLPPDVKIIRVWNSW